MTVSFILGNICGEKFSPVSLFSSVSKSKRDKMFLLKAKEGILKGEGGGSQIIPFLIRNWALPIVRIADTCLSGLVSGQVCFCLYWKNSLMGPFFSSIPTQLKMPVEGNTPRQHHAGGWVVRPGDQPQHSPFHPSPDTLSLEGSPQSPDHQPSIK